MKSLCLALSVALISVVTAAFAQSTATPAPKTEAQKSFDLMKTLAGNWEGRVSLDPPHAMGSDGSNPTLRVSMRVTSRGHAIVHEVQEAGMPLDPTKYDHPVTMIYIDKSELNLVHYCDAGNRPHMVARTSPDGKKVEFDFVDLSGSNQYGHMYHAVFTAIDADHHIEDWTYMMPGDKPMHAHFELHRVQ
jgi:hypothetical protein